MKKKRKRIAIFLLCVMLLLPYDIVFASKIPQDGIENEVLEENEDRFGTTSPWFSGTQDNSIYENAIDAGEEDTRYFSKYARTGGEVYSRAYP